MADGRWQRRMAPLMVGAVLTTAIFFAWVTLAKFGAIAREVDRPPDKLPPIVWTRPGIEPATWRDQADLTASQVDYALEQELIARRYQEANLAFSVRLWTRFMGFMTGMILAMVGAAFVLGKLDAPESEFSGSAHGASVALKSASPGMVLSVLGTLLMGLAIGLPVTTAVYDAAVYVRAPQDRAPSPPPAPPAPKRGPGRPSASLDWRDEPKATSSD